MIDYYTGKRPRKYNLRPKINIYTMPKSGEQHNPKTIDFLNRFLEKRNPPPVYGKIENTLSKKKVFEDPRKIEEMSGKLFQVYDFPSYLRPTVNQKADGWKLNVLNTYSGSMINLTQYEGIDDYLKQNFSAGRRSKFRTYKKRLEIAFNIEYKTYYGYISKQEYNNLFDALYQMITRRFSQRNLQNHDIGNWEVYKEIAYPLINKKEGVLFVIYHDKKPISISFDILFDKIVYGYLRSYDIDYAKFYLGFIDANRQLEWHFTNGFEIFDLLKGQYDYKSKLTDSSYYFQKHIIYDSKSFAASVQGTLTTIRVKLFYNFIKLLKMFKVHLIYHKLMDYIIQRKLSKSPLTASTKNKEVISCVDIVELEDSKILKPISLENRDFFFLKKHVYDFLYTNKESLDSIKLFELKGESNAFAICGQKKILKIAFETV